MRVPLRLTEMRNPNRGRYTPSVLEESSALHGMAFYRSRRPLLSPGKAWAVVVISEIPAPSSDSSVFLPGLPFTSTMNPTCIVYSMKRLGSEEAHQACMRAACRVGRVVATIYGVSKTIHCALQHSIRHSSQTIMSL
ncbi:PREDICTED: uncharacterized protein LOC105455461 [Wasmannia auropunctata]|uniref:uncharacterized protein LOC105455461 n=1 Tax=Wasmannia auropunctata TaxID=64793 RepID=UPI0005EECF6E|nr:PREDICTED: uncharacterized protein LOC105455461 [Wasmannia auropunctata]